MLEDIVPPVTLSVIVPCRNENDHIEACVTSILKQDFPYGDLEIIVADGLSDDGTRDKLQKLSKQYPSLHIVDNPGRIAASARNVGLQQARGTYIAIMDAHTEYAPDYLRVCLELLNQHPDICCAGGPIISRGVGAFGRAVAAAMSHPVGIGNAKHRLPDYEGYAEGACFPVFRKEVFDQVGTFDESMIRTEDDEFNFRVTRNGGKIFISPRASCVYYVRETPSQLFWQYCQYGYWRVAVLRKHRIPASLRQLMPFAFLGVMVASLVAGVSLPGPWRLIGLFVPTMYLLALLGGALQVMVQTRSLLVGLLFPVPAAIMHFSYALGFGLAILGVGGDKMGELRRRGSGVTDRAT